MKISVWNLMRPNATTVEKNKLFLETLEQQDSDIIILTETNSVIDLGNKYFSVSTLPLPEEINKVKFKPGENRVTIFSKTPFIKEIPTADSYTSVCAETVTAFGPLTIYGTIIGYLGGNKKPFEEDLAKQTLDIKHLSKQGNLCFAGDLNIAFSGWAYPSPSVIENVSQLFDDLKMTLITKDFENCAIHGVISNSFLNNVVVKEGYMLFDKKITDHRLVTITLTSKD